MAAMRPTDDNLTPDRTAGYLTYEQIKEQRQKYKMCLIADIFKALELICADSLKTIPLWYNNHFDTLIDLSNYELEGRLEACQQIVKDIHGIH